MVANETHAHVIMEIKIGNMAKNKITAFSKNLLISHLNLLIGDKLADVQGLPARYQLKSFTHSASISICVLM
jgi:hypothetical protein